MLALVRVRTASRPTGSRRSRTSRRARAAPPEPQGALTPREREVLGLLAEGSTSADAARRLSISEETVQTHVRRAMGKLRARSRTQAVAAALRLGLLPEAA